MGEKFNLKNPMKSLSIFPRESGNFLGIYTVFCANPYDGVLPQKKSSKRDVLIPIWQKYGVVAAFDNPLGWWIEWIVECWGMIWDYTIQNQPFGIVQQMI